MRAHKPLGKNMIILSGLNSGRREMEEEKKMKMRINAGLCYIGVGLVFILLSRGIPSWFYKAICILWSHKAILFWCLGCTSFGVGAGIIRTRDHNYGKEQKFKWKWYLLHHIGYYGFVLLAISILAFVIPLYISGENYTNPGVKFYSLSALIGLIGGFLGDMFSALVESFLRSNHNK